MGTPKNDLSAIINSARDDVSPATFAKLQSCQPTTCGSGEDLLDPETCSPEKPKFQFGKCEKLCHYGIQRTRINFLFLLLSQSPPVSNTELK